MKKILSISLLLILICSCNKNEESLNIQKLVDAKIISEENIVAYDGTVTIVTKYDQSIYLKYAFSHYEIDTYNDTVKYKSEREYMMYPRDNSVSEIKERRKNRNITLNESRKGYNKYIDSLYSSEEKKVFGKIKFGMTSNEVDSLLTLFKNENKADNNSDLKISDFIIDRFVPTFHNNAIYRLDVSGKRYQSNSWYSSETLFQLKVLYSLLKAKYGVEKYNRIPSKQEVYEPQEGYNLTAEWIINDKKIGLYINKEGNYSNIVMVINSEKISDIVAKKEELKKIKEDNKSKKLL
ncbi:hypothetical protein [Kordia sp.]|uniref:hypothetical protein n=1 Tax=Kordia sp. TaxID=1965332 RepID=UPI003D6B786A